MIWKWINAVSLFLHELFSFPPIPPPAIDPNEQCRGCGNRLGTIIADPQPDGRMLIRHQCRVCQMKWWVNTVWQEPIAATSATVKISAASPKE